LSRCQAELRKVNAEMKSTQTSHDNQLRRLQTQIEKLEKAKEEALSIKDDVAKQMKNIASLRNSGDLQMSNSTGEDIATQKATAKIRREMIRLQKELDNEKEANNNLQQRLARALKQKKRKKMKKKRKEIQSHKEKFSDWKMKWRKKIWKSPPNKKNWMKCFFDCKTLKVVIPP